MARRQLSDRQKARIAQIQARRRERMSRRAEAALDAHTAGEELPGRVLCRFGQNLVVTDAAGNPRPCLVRANLNDVVCGDHVVWQPTADGAGVITAVQPRHGVLARPDYSGRQKPLAANLTQLVIVVAPRPEPTGYLIDQYLVTSELIGLQACIALNKSDLLDTHALAAFQQRFARYADIGYPLISVSAKTDHGLDPLRARLQGHTSILVGQSGVGKSSLVKALLPDREVQIGRLSAATGLGRHTTSTTMLYPLPSGGELVDSPGVRSFRLGRLSLQELARGFRELHALLGHCRFANCRHDQEPDCALRAAVERGEVHPERLANYRHMGAQLDTRH